MDLKTLYHSTIGRGVAIIVGLSTVAGAFVTLSNILATDEELRASEARIISEVRSESADTRFILIEDMESRLDEFDYDISILESKNEVVPESLRIKRNMLDRRIKRLKHNEDVSDTAGSN